MKSHPDGGASRLLRDGIAPAIDDGFIRALKKGRIKVFPEVVRYGEYDIYLADGSKVSPDIVLFATGYKTGLEQILGHLDILDLAGVPCIHGNEQDPGYPGLWFTGMRPMLSGFFRAAGKTGKSIAKAIYEIEKRRSIHHDPTQKPSWYKITRQSGLVEESE